MKSLPKPIEGLPQLGRGGVGNPFPWRDSWERVSRKDLFGSGPSLSSSITYRIVRNNKFRS